jgi:hypothetical protein
MTLGRRGGNPEGLDMVLGQLHSFQIRQTLCRMDGMKIRSKNVGEIRNNL